MSWNANNLYNLSQRTALPDLSRRTVFQQKWVAKRELRAYHVPNITEKQLLNRHWRNQLPLRHFTRAEAERVPPVQALAFGELERRLDVVVFRSHFASSIWNARQSVVNGRVKLNGKKCRFPATRLEPGDIVTIDPKAIPTLRKTKEAKKEKKVDGGAEASKSEESPKDPAAPPAEATADAKGAKEAEAPNKTAPNAEATTSTSPTGASATKLEQPAHAAKERFDPKEPLALPFTEVPFMSPWMFIPEYLEVSYRTCSAIFLRSPLPQCDRVEIPSPFPPDLHALAFEWYATQKKRKTKRPDLKDPIIVGGREVRLKPKFEKIVRQQLFNARDAAKKARFEKDKNLNAADINESPSGNVHA